MARTKKATVTRTSDEFDVGDFLNVQIAPPRSDQITSGWDPAAMRKARLDLQQGQFAQPAALLTQVLTDPACFASFENRLAPIRGLGVEIIPKGDKAPTARARRQADEAEPLYGDRGISLSLPTSVTMNKNLAAFGLAVAVQNYVARPDGTRIDPVITAWPQQHLRWNRATKVLQTLTDAGEIVDIVHGDGRWIVARKEEIDPWKSGALVALAGTWMDRAYGIRDRARSSITHGNAKILGELPAGVKLLGKDSNGATVLTTEAKAMLRLLTDMLSGLAAGIRPAGSKVDYLVNSSQAWEIWRNIIEGDAADIAAILLGSFGNAKGGNSYVKDSYLFGVRNDIVEGDLYGIGDAIHTGSILPWAAINFGDSDSAPLREYKLPDADQEARIASLTEAMVGFFAVLKSARDSGVELTQEWIDDLANKYEIPTVALPVIAPVAEPAPAPPPVAPLDPIGARTAALFADLSDMRRSGIVVDAETFSRLVAAHGLESLGLRMNF